MARTYKDIPKNADAATNAPRVTRTVEIKAGQLRSSPVYVKGEVLVGIVVPPTWNASSLAFEVSFDRGSSWHPVYTQNGTQAKVFGLVPEAYHAVPAVPLMGISHLRLVASAEQASDQYLHLILMQ